MGRGPVVASVAPRRERLAGLVLGGLLILVAGLTPGCYAPQLALLKSGLDSLRTEVDTMRVRDSVSYRVLQDTRREVGEQRDILLSTKATAGSTTQEIFDLMGRLEGKLDEAMHFFSTRSERANTGAIPSSTPPPSTTPGDTSHVAKPASPAGTPAPSPTPAPAPTNPSAPAAPDPVSLYDQATQDLTQGRYGLALQGFREFVRRFPAADLADNAQYGAGECFFAQAAFDSASVEYARVTANYPKGDRIPASMYKLALCQEKLGRAAESRRTLEDLVRNWPASSEAKLARERLGDARR